MYWYGKRKVTGHIETRKNSQGEISHYRAVLNLGKDENGKRIRPYKKAPTEEEAEVLLIKMKAEYLDNEFILPSEMKVKKYLEEWFSAYIENQRSESTVLDYRDILDRYLIPTWGEAKLQSLNALNIQKTFNSWSKKSPVSGNPLADESLKHIRRVFNTALNKAVDLEFLKRNPLKGVSIGRNNVKKEIEILSEEEVKQLFAVVKGTEFELIVAFLFDTLARRAEALGARWSDLDMETGVILIQNTYIRTLTGGQFNNGTKTQSSKRSIVLTDYTLDLLKKERHNQKIRKMKYGPKYEDNDLIICQENGRPYQPDSFTNKWSRMLKKYGIRHIKLHGVRHTGISMMASLGLHPKYVQERAGHKTMDITMNIYTHVNKDQKIKTSQTINDKFFKNVANN